jgi:hypothetical protein
VVAGVPDDQGMPAHPRATGPLRYLACTLVGALLLATVGLVAPPTAAAAPNPGFEAEFFQLLNHERTRRGLAALQHDARLADTSRAWSAHMASRDLLHHAGDLAQVASRVEPQWRRIGENVGVGYSVRSLHDAFMASAGHRDNALRPDFNRVGIGVHVAGGGRIWVTVRLLTGPALQTAQAAPTTQPATATAAGPCRPPRTTSATMATGDFTGDGHHDVVQRGTGSHPATLHRGSRDRRFATMTLPSPGQRIPLAGDFDGNGRDEIIWYAPGPDPDELWSWNGSGFDRSPLRVNGHFRPQVGDLDGDGRDDVIWYAPGPAQDYIWYGTATRGRFESVPVTVNGHYRVAVADLDGDGRDDVVWHAPGPAHDYIWYGLGRGRFQSVHVRVNGDFIPLAGDFDGDRRHDIYWYAPGPASDFIWYGSPNRGGFHSILLDVFGHYQPVTGDFDRDCRSDILWAAGSVTGSPIWYGSPNRGGFTRSRAG